MTHQSSNPISMRWIRHLPIIGWLRHYRWREDGGQDALAAVLVCAMLIPQALSYALLAGLPVETGLYASIVPPILYAVFGSSRSLSVGPMAVTSLMSAHIIAKAQQQLGMSAIDAAMIYALLSGLFLLLLGILRFGFVAKLISQPVMAGFNNASVLVIVWPQLFLLADLHTPLSQPLMSATPKPWALGVGLASITVLWLGKQSLPRWLGRWLGAKTAQQWCKTIPLAVVATAIMASLSGWLPQGALDTVGTIPPGLPTWQWPPLSTTALRFFALPAVIMALVIYVNAISVGQVLAARHQDKLNPNQELIALGAANVSAAFSGAFPITGGFSRSAVNDDAGARSQMAGIFTAMLMAAATVWLAPVFGALPKTVLAAVIITSVIGMFNTTVFRQLWQYSRGEWLVMMATLAAALLWRVDIGIAVGMLASFALLISRSAKPHMAEIGRLPNSESFRNIRHFNVTTWPHLVSIRIDDGLQFFNHQHIAETIQQRVHTQASLRYVVLQCHGINHIDYSGAQALLQLQRDLARQNITLVLSEIKMPVQQQLDKLHFRRHFDGHIFLTHNQAVEAILATSAHADLKNHTEPDTHLQK